MAHVWHGDDSGAWKLTMLVDDEFALEASLLVRRVAGRVDEWALVSPTHGNTRVNGVRVMTGLTILTDRDEIRPAGGPTWFFSTETQAHVEPFPDSDGRGFCPRCRLPIATGTPAVHCPRCGLWYHQSDEFPCWTYAPQCTACPQLTELGAGLGWTPERL
ncbi:MAG TPA: hypothetical protein VH702_09510 [Vicinamibacterales bacterium]|jgi:hypothetical protein